MNEAIHAGVVIMLIAMQLIYFFFIERISDDESVVEMYTDIYKLCCMVIIFGFVLPYLLRVLM